MFKAKIVSSLEKAFINGSIDAFPRFEKMSALKGERIRFQLLFVNEKEEVSDDLLTTYAKVKAFGELAEFASIRNVEQVGVTMTAYESDRDDNYLSFEPGIYPDLLTPLRNGDGVVFGFSRLKSLWIEIDIPKDIDAGNKVFGITIADNAGKVNLTEQLTVHIIDAVIPENQLYFTQWFHCDCLAQYYNVPVWSERHWEIVENFAKVAARNGINMILTPVFTPPLDTGIGHERLTTQLVGVTKTAGGYEFDFSLLKRWIEMCDRVGIKYFEIAHFYTQWGAYHAPKIMATVDGEYKRIFGWDTDAHSTEYTEFIRAFTKSLLDFMRARGDDKRCFFHISDEPIEKDIESYEKSYSAVADLLDGYTVMDALSRYEFYEKGIVKTAIPASNHIKPFLEHKVPKLWTYYCCVQGKAVSNRFLSMPSWRNRSIGMQMFKYDIVGFLHWGYNYYNNRYSYDAINPFVDASGDEFVPAGDMFSVYPAQDGTALESLRIGVFFDALQDIAAMKLCAELYSKEDVVEEIEKIFGQPVAFDKCAYSAEPILKIRERINEMIEKKI